jgi:DNA primase
MIEREKIEEIKRQTDIVSLILEYIPLKKVGKNYRALCPFHSEKYPSFYVNPEKGIYYCFGCKKGGNAITFLMEYEKMDFPDAVRKLGKNLGIEIDTTKGLKYRELYEVNEFACQFYSLCLGKDIGRRGQNYLTSRKVTLHKLKDFRLGYAPASGGLLIFMRQKGIPVERLNQAGLITMNHEIFRDRLIFPIFNLSGRIIGFGGRGIDDYMQPKYLNSPETPIFKKGSVLYGLYQTKESMRTKNKALLVEGYFDLLSLYQRGFTNICAPLGTSLTEQQAILISRFAKRVNILFDGDMSGIKAALRAVGLLINAQVDVYVSSLPENLDPDTFIQQVGIDELNNVVESAPDFFHFYKDMVKVDTIEQEITLIKDLIQIIGNIQDPIRFDRYLKHISHVFGIHEDTIKGEMEDKKVLQTPKPTHKPRITQEERLMAMILNAKDHFSLVKEILSPDDFNQEDIRRLYKTKLKHECFDLDDLSTAADESLREKMYSIIMKEEPVSKEAFLDALFRYKSTIEERRILAKISQLSKNGDAKSTGEYRKKLDILKEQLAFKRKMLNITTAGEAVHSDE